VSKSQAIGIARPDLSLEHIDVADDSAIQLKWGLVKLAWRRDLFETAGIHHPIRLAIVIASS